MFTKSPQEKLERANTLRTAEAIVSLAETEGWAHFLKAAESIIVASMPDVESFSEGEATEIASKMAFISGVRRCIGLMNQAQETLSDSKKKGS